MDLGSIKDTTGDRSIKKTRNVIRIELTKVHDAFVKLQDTVDKSG